MSKFIPTITEDGIKKSLESKRRGSVLKKKLNIPSPLRSIRLKCLDCVVGNPGEVQRCHIEECSLWPFRFGRNPREADLMVPEYDKWGEREGEHFYKGFEQVKKLVAES